MRLIRVFIAMPRGGRSAKRRKVPHFLRQLGGIMNMYPHQEEGTVRLAESDTVAVDMCPCGTIHLHVGALSLRLRPDGAASLLQTLGIAFARRQAMISRA